MKYKVGDFVKVKDNLEVRQCYDRNMRTLDMFRYRGRKTRVTHVWDFGDGLGGGYSLACDDNKYFYPDDMLEPIKPKFNLGDMVIYENSPNPYRIIGIDIYRNEFVYQLDNSKLTRVPEDKLKLADIKTTEPEYKTGDEFMSADGNYKAQLFKVDGDYCSYRISNNKTNGENYYRWSQGGYTDLSIFKKIVEQYKLEKIEPADKPKNDAATQTETYRRPKIDIKMAEKIFDDYEYDFSDYDGDLDGDYSDFIEVEYDDENTLDTNQSNDTFGETECDENSDCEACQNFTFCYDDYAESARQNEPADGVIATIRREGNTIYLVAGDKVISKAVCHPGDDFNEDAGMALCLNRAAEYYTVEAINK